MVLDGELIRRLARSSGLSRSEVTHLLELEMITLPDQTVRPSLVRRLRRVRRMRRDLGLSIDAVVIIMRLLDRIEILEGSRPRGLTARVVDQER